MIAKVTIILFLLLLSNFSGATVLPIAHRGASAYAPENTISAIAKAIELRSPYIEIDVHMTKDGEVVAIHDATVDRTSNASGRVIDYTLLELKKLDFGTWFDSKFRDERIPTLKEVLTTTGQKTILIIEFKYGTERYPLIESKVANLVKSMGLEEFVILKSFSSKILKSFERIAPEIDRLYCTFWGNDWFTIDNSFRFHGILEKGNFGFLQVHKYFLTKTLISKAHAKGIQVIVWDVHDLETMARFNELGVDLIESDYPDLVLKLKN